LEVNNEVKLQNGVKPSITAAFGSVFHSRHYGVYWGLPAYLGNAFTHIQYRMSYICPGPIFQLEFNCDVNLVIGLTKFGNFGELAHIYMYSAPIFNADPNLVIWGIGTHVYAFSIDFQCESSHDVNLVIRLTKFGNLRNWYTCICIQH
jgi:hypothetical protein